MVWVLTFWKEGKCSCFDHTIPMNQGLDADTETLLICFVLKQ